MAEKWRELEENCLQYLNEKYKNVSFIGYGQSDSTKPDIKVETANGDFYIEVKSSKAQSGQFVLIPDEINKTFIFSPKNKSEKDDYTVQIINYMDRHFGYFCEAGTKGIDLLMPEEIFAGWIKKYYKGKGVKYFITHNDVDNEYIIFPLEKFGEYFSVEGKYRVKKSGSSDISQKDRDIVISKVKSDGKYVDSKVDGKILYIIGDNSLEDITYNIEGSDYIFNKICSGTFRVRKLSNTYNANVIFNIDLKKNQSIDDLKVFEADLT